MEGMQKLVFNFHGRTDSDQIIVYGKKNDGFKLEMGMKQGWSFDEDRCDECLES